MTGTSKAPSTVTKVQSTMLTKFRPGMNGPTTWRPNFASLLTIFVVVVAMIGMMAAAETRSIAPMSEDEEFTPRGVQRQNGAWKPWPAQPAMYDDNQQQQPSAAGPASYRTPEKRRLVVRVPFAQNPDGHQLSRIYKSLFEPSNNRAKKQPWTYSLRHFVQSDDAD